MSAIAGVSQAGQTLQAAYSRIGEQTAALTGQLGEGDVSVGSLAETVVQLKVLKLQAAVAGQIFQTLNDMASELLTQPRK